MPPRPRTYQYNSQDNPLTVAQQFNLQPQQLINANPGGYPFSTGQTINIPNFMSPGAANPYQAARNAAQSQPFSYAARNVPQQYQRYLPQHPTQRFEDGSMSQTFEDNSSIPLANPGFPVNPQLGISSQVAGNSAYLGQGVYLGGGGATPGESNYVRRGGSPDASAMFQLTDLAATNPEKLSPEQQQQVYDYLQQRAGTPAKTDAQGNGYTADESQSPGGRFIQVGEKRWERNKNGRLVQVQYTGGGSWRNKRVISGGKNQGGGGNRPQQVREDPNGRLAGVGLVNFNVGSG